MFFRNKNRKSIERSHAELEKKFRILGVSDIEFQISEELDENSNPRLAPLVLFHNIWGAVIRKNDIEWLEESIKHFEMRKELTGIAAAKWPQDDDFLTALHAVVQSGVDLKHITAIAKRAQEHLLNHVAYTLSNSDSDEPAFEDVHWAVFETDEEGNPLRQLNMLHELYGIVDPEGQE